MDVSTEGASSSRSTLHSENTSCHSVSDHAILAETGSSDSSIHSEENDSKDRGEVNDQPMASTSVCGKFYIPI